MPPVAPLLAALVLSACAAKNGSTSPPAAADEGGDAVDPASTSGSASPVEVDPAAAPSGEEPAPPDGAPPDAAEDAEGAAQADDAEPPEDAASPEADAAEGAEASPPEPAAPPIERFVGDYRYVGGDKQRQAAVAAIEAALADLDPISRSLAKRKLAERDPAVPAITVAFDAGHTSIRRKETTVRAPLDGPAVKVKHDGREAMVSHRLATPAKLVERIQGAKGKTVNTFALSDDGERLTVTTQIDGERLSGPIRYRLSYRRR